MVKGGVFAWLRTVNSSTKTSISPVAKFGFLDSRSITVPLTLITNSLPRVSAFSKTVFRVRSSSKTNWVIP